MACNTCAPCSPTDQTCVTVYPVLSPCSCDDPPAIREEGPAGGAATISVGTVITSSPGGDAAVVNVGTSSVAVFDFTIPRGATGPMPAFDVPIHMTSTLQVDGAFTPSGGIVGVSDGSDAASGIVGEIISSSIGSGSPVPLSNGANANITAISLTAGDWDVSGSIGIIPAGTTSTTGIVGGSSDVSAVFSGENITIFRTPPVVVGAFTTILPIPVMRWNLSSTTLIYLVIQADFTVSTCGGFGHISARRVR